MSIPDGMEGQYLWKSFCEFHWVRSHWSSTLPELGGGWAQPQEGCHPSINALAFSDPREKKESARQKIRKIEIYMACMIYLQLWTIRIIKYSRSCKKRYLNLYGRWIAQISDFWRSRWLALVPYLKSCRINASWGEFVFLEVNPFQLWYAIEGIARDACNIIAWGLKFSRLSWDWKCWQTVLCAM